MHDCDTVPQTQCSSISLLDGCSLLSFCAVLLHLFKLLVFDTTSEKPQCCLSHMQEFLKICYVAIAIEQPLCLWDVKLQKGQNPICYSINDTIICEKCFLYKWFSQCLSFLETGN